MGCPSFALAQGAISSQSVGWAKRLHAHHHEVRSMTDGGHVADAPLPTLRISGSTLNHVTQRPGWSSLATSVRTLTGGSQAMAVFDVPGLDAPGLAGGAGRFRTSSLAATGTRTTTDMSARPTLRIVIVSVWPDAALSAARSA